MKANYDPHMTVFGIKNCNTVKSALNWLKENDFTFNFHDYKAKGITEERLKSWIKQVGWEVLVNKKGTTWRELDEATQKSITNEKAAIALMMEKTSVIKRPVIERDGDVIVIGFEDALYRNKL